MGSLGALSRAESESYLQWLTDASRKEVAALEALGADSSECLDTDLAEYSRLALEYGRRLWVMTQEWAAWAADQVAARGRVSGDGVSPEPRQNEDEAVI